MPISKEQCLVIGVDDQKELVELMGLIFRDEGFQVMVSENPSTMLERVRGLNGEQKDIRHLIVFADYSMPGQDGVSFIQELIQVVDQQNTTLPEEKRRIVYPRLVTALDSSCRKDQEAIAHFKSLPRSLYISKPFDFEDLIGAANNLDNGNHGPKN